MVTMGRSALREVDLLIARGADFQQSLRFRSGTPLQPVDLTGWKARAQIRDRAGTEPWLTISDGHGIDLGANGIITLTIGHARTQDWTGTHSGRWDLLLIAPSGQRIRAVEGRVTISRGITSDA